MTSKKDDESTIAKRKDQINGLLDAIKTNQKNLDSCEGHTFGDYGNVDESLKKFGSLGKIKLTCTKCKGQLPLNAIGHYGAGYKAAGKNPDDVLLNYFK